MCDILTAQRRPIICFELKPFGKGLFELIESFLNPLASLPNLPKAPFLDSVYKPSQISDDLG